MVATSGALMSKKEVLEPFLKLVLRDDLLSWHDSKAPVNRSEEQRKAASAFFSTISCLLFLLQVDRLYCIHDPVSIETGMRHVYVSFERNISRAYAYFF